MCEIESKEYLMKKRELYINTVLAISLINDSEKFKNIIEKNASYKLHEFTQEEYEEFRVEKVDEFIKLISQIENKLQTHYNANIECFTIDALNNLVSIVTGGDDDEQVDIIDIADSKMSST